MPYFKDTQGALHFLSDTDVAGGFERLLPTGCVQLTDAEVQSALNPPPTVAERQASIVNAIQFALNTKARERGYDDAASACTYAAPAAIVASNDPNFAQCEKFRAEGNAIQAWRASTWAACYAYLATVEGGTNPMPTPAEAVAMMPAFAWPA